VPARWEPQNRGEVYLDVLVTSCAELPGLVAALVLVGKLGSKCVLWVMLLAAGVLLLPLAHPLHPLPTTVLLFASRAAISGSFSLLWAYTPEVYPTQVRSTGLGIANSWGRLGGFLCPFVAVSLLQSCHRVCRKLLTYPESTVQHSTEVQYFAPYCLPKQRGGGGDLKTFFLKEFQLATRCACCCAHCSGASGGPLCCDPSHRCNHHRNIRAGNEGTVLHTLYSTVQGCRSLVGAALLLLRRANYGILHEPAAQ